MKEGRIKSSLFELGKYVLALTIMLFIVEFISFVIFNVTDASAVYGRKPSGFFVSDNTPNATMGAYEALPGNIYKPTENIEIDDNGYIVSHPVSLEKDTNTLRIMIEGGSAAWGSGKTGGVVNDSIYFEGTYDFKSSIAGILEQLLKDSLPNRKVEVINAAIVGHTIYQHFAKFLAKDHQLKPDIVITFAGHNDAQNICSGEYYAFSEKEIMDYIALEAEGVANRFPYSIFLIKRFISRNSEFRSTAKIKPDDDKFNFISHDTTDGYFESNKQLLVKNSEELFQIIDSYAYEVKKNGAYPILCLQPMLHRYDLQKKLSIKECLLRKSYADFFQPSIPYYFGEYFAARADSIMSKNQGEFIDMQKVVATKDAETEVYMDYCHLTFYANQICAEAMAKSILKHIHSKSTSN